MRSDWLLAALFVPALLNAQTRARTRTGHHAPASTHSTSVRPAAPAAPARAATDSAARDASADSSTTDSLGTSEAPSLLATEHRTALRRSPNGVAAAALDSGARVTTLARDRGWVRVRVEGWVRASDLTSVDTTVLTAISAADIRAEPDRFRGQTVRWQVQKIALQTADPLRREMAPDEPYLLARGPGNESSLLYLALPPSLVDQARRIDPLATIIVTARVRAGRSAPSGVPLLDVESIVQR